MQLAQVADDHEVVRQSLERTVSVVVSSEDPKLRPVTLMELPPVSGELPTTWQMEKHLQLPVPDHTMDR